MLGKLLVMGALGAGVGLAAPLWRERAPNECEALARRILAGAQPARRAPDGGLAALAALDPAASGAVVAAMVRARYPEVTPELGCAAVYWAVVADPTLRRRILRLAGRLPG